MSYILNALRKLEQERQAIEPDTVTNRILVPQPLTPQRSTGLIAILIISILVVLAYFIGVTQKTPPADTQPTAPVVQPAPAPQTEMPPPPKARPPEPKAPSIADIVEARTAPAQSAMVKKPLIELVNPALAPPQPVPEKAEPAEEANPVEDAFEKSALLPVKKVEPISTATEIPAPLPVKSNLLFLNELPAEFRRTLPNLPINVFVYSPVPAERFVMIDMVKYTPGQRIKDLLELKEIRPDSLIVSYKNRTFKIKRP